MTGRPEFPCSFQSDPDRLPCGSPSTRFYVIAVSLDRPPYGRCEEHRHGDELRQHRGPNQIWREVPFEEAVMIQVMMK